MKVAKVYIEQENNMDTEFNFHFKLQEIPLLMRRPCCHDYSWRGSACMRLYRLKAIVTIHWLDIHAQSIEHAIRY